MKNPNGWPVIEASDYPVTILRALHNSIASRELGLSDEEHMRWTKIVQDAESTLQDSFGIVDPDSDDEPINPNGEALIYVSPDDLGLSLVAYGSLLPESEEESAHEELLRVDHILNAIHASVASRK